jgi:anti-sigma factor RsiW
MSVRIQPGAMSNSVRGLPLWRAAKLRISVFSAALLARYTSPFSGFVVGDAALPRRHRADRSRRKHEVLQCLDVEVAPMRQQL